MRVTSSATFRNFSASINDVHSRLNKSMNKISTGRAYETAADNPLAYYEGKQIDSQYQDILSKNSLLTDIKNRLYQQELGARSIQNTLTEAKVKVEYALNVTTQGTTDIQTIRDDLLQKQQSVVNDLNGQYQDFYIYGGNDISTPPFSLSADGKTLTFQHKFPGSDDVTTFTMELRQQPDGGYQFENGSISMDPPSVTVNGNSLTVFEALQAAMSEQGRVDVGYGSINDTDTLLDTYTGGLNLLTGMNSDGVKAMAPAEFETQFLEQLNSSPIALIGQAALVIDDYVSSKTSGTGATSQETLNNVLSSTMDAMAVTEHTISTVYADLGNKYSLLTTTGTRLDSLEDSLTQQYTDKLGADPYEAIVEMFQNQSSYDAALQVSARLMGSSLFDFMS